MCGKFTECPKFSVKNICKILQTFGFKSLVSRHVQVSVSSRVFAQSLGLATSMSRLGLEDFGQDSSSGHFQLFCGLMSQVNGIILHRKLPVYSVTTIKTCWSGKLHTKVLKHTNLLTLHPFDAGTLRIKGITLIKAC